MQCPRCNAMLEEGTVFCGNCGNQVAPLNAQGGTVAATAGEMQYGTTISSPVKNSYPVQGQALQTPPVRTIPEAAPGSKVPIETPAPGAPSRPRGPNIGGRGRIVLITALVLVVIAAGTVGLLAFVGGKNNNNIVASAATGAVAFRDSQGGAGHTDTLKISISGLNAPASGSHYYAWLINTTDEKILALGKLVTDGQNFSLDFTNGGKHNLLGEGDRIEITLEQGDVNSPTGTIVLAANFTSQSPKNAFTHIKHLLYSFPTTPKRIGLLVGLREQAQLLSGQALALQNAVSSHNTVALKCAAQSIIDIIEGRNGSHFQALGAACSLQNISQTGDGFGLSGSNGYIATAKAHASLAATQPDTTDNIRLHAKHVEIAMENLKGWVTTIDQDALKLLQNTGDTSKVAEIVQLANQVLNGVDIDNDEHVDPVPGEAGAITAYIHAQLMAELQQKPGA